MTLPVGKDNTVSTTSLNNSHLLIRYNTSLYSPVTSSSCFGRYFCKKKKKSELGSQDFEGQIFSYYNEDPVVMAIHISGVFFGFYLHK